MFNFLKIKTELELQIEDYIAWKARYSIYSAEQHKKILSDFLSYWRKCKSVRDMNLEMIASFHKDMQSTPFTKAKAMQAIRCFIRHTRKLHDINPDCITDEGIVEFQPRLLKVAENAIITPMIKKNRVGRPPNVAFIKEVKYLKDKVGLGIVAIARAKNMNRGNISRAYHYDLSKIA